MPLGTAAPLDGPAELGFDPQPSFIPNDVIVPTFDDVPDDVNMPPTADFGAGGWTKKLVQYLDANNMHFDFFINTNNFCDVQKTPGCMQTLTSILRTQNPGNHTIHHISMGVDNPDFNVACDTGTPKSKTTCDAEIMGVEAVVAAASMGARPHLTRFRAPFGTPYFEDDRRALAKIRPVVGKYAVHVGWQIDSLDASCDMCHFTGQMISDNVIKKIGTGPGKGEAWGIILMHGVFPGSIDAAKILFDPKTGYAKVHNFRLATVEDVVCWKYGKHSWQIVQELNPGQTRAAN
jgi:peptidoglycan/xylan/chitin deacetylase (PgdA/CDA1 family)